MRIKTRKRAVEEKVLWRLWYKEWNSGREQYQNKEWERRISENERGESRGRAHYKRRDYSGESYGSRNRRREHSEKRDVKGKYSRSKDRRQQSRSRSERRHNLRSKEQRYLQSSGCYSSKGDNYMSRRNKVKLTKETGIRTLDEKAAEKLLEILKPVRNLQELIKDLKM